MITNDSVRMMISREDDSNKGSTREQWVRKHKKLGIKKMRREMNERRSDLSGTEEQNFLSDNDTRQVMEMMNLNEKRGKVQHR